MKKTVFSAFALILGLALAAAVYAGETGSWTGTLTDTHCAAKGATESHADCAVKCVKDKGAKWALYTSDKQLFELSGDTSNAASLAGKEVTVSGSLDKDKKSIEVTSLGAKK